jgi:hypothetical protein
MQVNQQWSFSDSSIFKKSLKRFIKIGSLPGYDTTSGNAWRLAIVTGPGNRASISTLPPRLRPTPERRRGGFMHRRSALPRPGDFSPVVRQSNQQCWKSG